jgi:formylglycine-generating enzyme required for sulfatase activity
MNARFPGGVVIAGLVVTAALVPLLAHLTRPAITVTSETVSIPPGRYAFRPAGSYRLYGKLIDPPLETVEATEPLEIMRYQVSRAEYAACVADGACEEAYGMPASRTEATSPDLPQTGVNWYDANAYAAWYSRQTRQHWRLPQDQEWQRAAVERFVDDAVDVDQGDDPAQRWLAIYRRNAAQRNDTRSGPQPRGTYGENSGGLADLASNVWEWTATCVANVSVADDRETSVDKDTFCGAHIAEGRHRAIVVDLVRNPKAGGCAVGVPPDYMGFRLVRER